MEYNSTTITEQTKRQIAYRSNFGLKPEIANLLSPLSFRPKGI